MKVVELFEDEKRRRYLEVLLPKLQAALDTKGANLAKASYKNGQFFGTGTHSAPHISVKPTRADQLSMAAVHNVIDKFKLEQTGLGFMGLELASTSSRSKVVVWLLDKKIDESAEVPLSQRLLPSLLKKLRVDFKDWTACTLSIEPMLEFLKKSSHLPSYVERAIVLKVNLGAHSRFVTDAQEHLVRSVVKHFPEENLLGIQPHMFQTERGAWLVLKQKLEESSYAMMKRVTERLKTDLEDLNQTLLKDIKRIWEMDPETEAPSPPFRVTEWKPQEGFNLYVRREEWVSDSIWEIVYGEVDEMLHENGYIDGLLPVDVSFGNTPDADTHVIHVR